MTLTPHSGVDYGEPDGRKISKFIHVLEESIRAKAQSCEFRCEVNRLFCDAVGENLGAMRGQGSSLVLVGRLSSWPGMLELEVRENLVCAIMFIERAERALIRGSDIYFKGRAERAMIY